MEADASYRDAMLVEFIAKRLWPILRPFVKRHLSRRCSICVLPEGHSSIDADGVCELCKTRDARVVQHETDEGLQARLDELIRSSIGSGPSGYDALILLSGGKDSAYMLHRIRREYPELRLLSMLVDNGFMSPFALRNARQTLAHFDVPHITLRLQPSFVKKAFRMALLNLDKQQGYSIVDLLDGNLTTDQAKNLALSLQIPLVLVGVGRIQAEGIMGPVTLELPPKNTRRSSTHLASLPLREFFDEAEMRYWFQAERWAPERVPRIVLPLAVWEPEEEEIIAEVTRLGLIDEKHTRPLVTNNALIPVIAMAEIARFGYTSFEVEFARMVRCGKSERAYWINLFEMAEYSAKTGRFLGRPVEATLAALDLTPADLGIMTTSRKAPAR